MLRVNKKLLKRVGALAMAGIMATSFTGCYVNLDKESLVNASEDEKIYLQNEEGQELVVVGFEEKDSGCESEELYGYFKDDKKLEFYNCLTGETLDFRVYNDRYNIYYNNFVDDLSSKYYVLVIQNGYIPRDQLTKIDEYFYFGKSKEGNYTLLDNYIHIAIEHLSDPFELITYEDEEAKKEETTLVKTNNK